MMIKKNGMAWTIVLTLMVAGLAGCLGGDDEDNEIKTINIAGSSTVYPVASAWGQAFMASNSDYSVTVAGGGSGAGASKVCSTDTDSVHIGDMSRDWKESEATVNADGYTFDCVNSDVTVTQLIVAVDGLSVIVKKGGAADQCRGNPHAGVPVPGVKHVRVDVVALRNSGCTNQHCVYSGIKIEDAGAGCAKECIVFEVNGVTDGRDVKMQGLPNHARTVLTV